MFVIIKYTIILLSNFFFFVPCLYLIEYLWLKYIIVIYTINLSILWFTVYLLNIIILHYLIIFKFDLLWNSLIYLGFIEYWINLYISIIIYLLSYIFILLIIIFILNCKVYYIQSKVKVFLSIIICILIFSPPDIFIHSFLIINLIFYFESNYMLCISHKLREVAWRN